MTAIWRLKRVLEETGKTRSPLYQDCLEGRFTRGVKIGDRAVGWPSHEVIAIVRARIAGASDSELRQLVSRLHEQRELASVRQDQQAA